MCILITRSSEKATPLISRNARSSLLSTATLWTLIPSAYGELGYGFEDYTYISIDSFNFSGNPSKSLSINFLKS